MCVGVCIYALPLSRDYPRSRSPAGLSAMEAEDLDMGSCSTTSKGDPQGSLPRKPMFGTRVVVRVVVAYLKRKRFFL